MLKEFRSNIVQVINNNQIANSVIYSMYMLYTVEKTTKTKQITS